ADDPLEQPLVLGGHLELRVARRDVTARMRQTQHVTVRNAVALAVLDRLVRERLHRLCGVPATDRTTERATPAAERLERRHELEQGRAGTHDLRERVERRLARRLVAEAGRHCEREDGRVVLRSAAVDAYAHDLCNCACAADADALLYGLCVLACQGPL